MTGKTGCDYSSVQIQMFFPADAAGGFHGVLRLYADS